MNSMILGMLLLSMSMNTLLPVSEQIKAETLAPFTSEADTLADIYDEADALIICMVEKSDSRIDGYSGAATKRALTKRLGDTRTDYNLTVLEGWKGEFEYGDELTISLPGGVFGNYTVDFGVADLEFDEYCSICFIALKSDGDRYAPILNGCAMLGDFRDMNGDGMIIVRHDEAYPLTPAIEVTTFDGIEKMSGLIALLDELAAPEETEEAEEVEEAAESEETAESEEAAEAEETEESAESDTAE